jgi:hypothetical protein
MVGKMSGFEDKKLSTQSGSFIVRAGKDIMVPPYVQITKLIKFIHSGYFDLESSLNFCVVQLDNQG